MKKIVLFIIAVMFLANTVAVSAWAKPCMNNTAMETSQSMEKATNDNMPCHGEEESKEANQNPDKHCEGICLCLHASISQTPIVDSGVEYNLPIASKSTVGFSNDVMVSRTPIPPRRPPKLNA